MITSLFEKLRGRWTKRWVRPAFRLLCELFMFVVPPRRQCAVFAWPDREGNGVEVLRALADDYPGRIYWLRSHPDADLSWLFEASQLKRIEAVDRSTLHGLLQFLMSEAVFFTHGAFDRPRFGRRRTYVNLWHGDGPKSMVGDPHARHDMPSSVIVGGTELWTKEKARHFRLPETSVLVTGNPRIDEFERPATDEQLVAIGLDPALPIICWAPTYRSDTGNTALAWAEGGRLSVEDAAARVTGVADAARTRGAQLVVKPHPLDTDRYAALGIRVITDSELDDARIGLYSLLAHCAAMITDYSSIWSDFLVLDRPIAFYCPDLQLYIASRGLNVSLESVAPGPFLEDTSDFDAFFAGVVAGSDPGREQRMASIKTIGAVVEGAATARLMRRVDDLRAAEGLRQLIRPERAGV